MKLTKKQICTLIAAVVSICFIICLVSTVQTAMLAARSGGTTPGGMVMLTIVTGACTFFIWRGVRAM